MLTPCLAYFFNQLIKTFFVFIFKSYVISIIFYSYIMFLYIVICKFLHYFNEKKGLYVSIQANVIFLLKFNDIVVGNLDALRSGRSTIGK